MQSPSPDILTRPLGGASPGDGSNLDRKLPRKRFTPGRLAFGAGALALVALVAWLVAGGGGGQRLRSVPLLELHRAEREEH